MSYTPINECKLKADAKDFLKKARNFNRFNVQRIYAPKKIYDLLLEAISPSERGDYVDSIPFEDKKIVVYKED